MSVWVASGLVKVRRLWASDSIDCQALWGRLVKGAISRVAWDLVVLVSFQRALAWPLWRIEPLVRTSWRVRRGVYPAGAVGVGEEEVVVFGEEAGGGFGVFGWEGDVGEVVEGAVGVGGGVGAEVQAVEDFGEVGEAGPGLGVGYRRGAVGGQVAEY
nr:hypothetical protein [Kribbella jiaozuonensis]